MLTLATQSLRGNTQRHAKQEAAAQATKPLCVAAKHSSAQRPERALLLLLRSSFV